VSDLGIRMVWSPRKKTLVTIAAISAIVVVSIYWRLLIFLAAVLIYTAWHRLMS
jgi:hypothetical protein